LNSGNFGGYITNAGLLNYNSSANQVLSGAITGGGSLYLSSPATLTTTANKQL